MSVPGVDVTDTFDQPFFAGSGAEPDDFSLPVSIDGRGFQLDTAEGNGFLRKSIKLLNTQQSQTGQDYAIEPPTVWRRSTESWHSGADQSRFDRADSIDTRYHKSIGIDPWTKYGIELLNDTKNFLALAPTAHALLCSIGDSLHVAIDDEVISYTSLADQTPVTKALTSNVIDITSDGENLYVLCSDGTVNKRDAAGVWSVFYTEAGLNPAKAMLSYCKGFLLLGNGRDLLNITSGARVLVHTHPLSGWWWREATEGLPVIYVLGGMGDRWHVHSVTISSNGATLNPPIVATTLPDGEVGYTVSSYMGYVLIGSGMGWRFAMPDGQGNLTYGQLIETSSPVQCFEGQGRFVWFGLSVAAATRRDWDKHVDQFTIYSEKSGLGRADLSVFVAPMTPAAASDLASSGQGAVRSVITVGGLTSGTGKRVFSVDGLGIFVEDDSLVAHGWCEQGVFTYNSTDKKMGLYAQVFHEPLIGKVEVEVAVDTDTGLFIPIGTNTAEGTVTVGNMPFPKSFNSIELRYNLYRSAIDHSAGPRLTRAEFRAINIPGRATEWHIPLLVFEATTWNDATRGRDVVSDYDYLMDLIRTRRQFTYREGDRTWNLHANDFVWTPDHLTSDRRTYQGTYLLIAREII